MRASNNDVIGTLKGEEERPDVETEIKFIQN